MSRRLDNLERLCNKLERRFGNRDTLFLLAKTELDTQTNTGYIDVKRHDWSTPYRDFIKNLGERSPDRVSH